MTSPWPRPREPLLPERLRAAWFYEPVPAAVLAACANFLVHLVTDRLYHPRDSELADQPFLTLGTRVTEDLRSLPLATRTKSALMRAGFSHVSERLPKASAYQLLQIRSFGPR